MASDTRFAVLDLGSTTFQLLVADADAEGSLTPVLRDRVVLNLGRVLAGEGRIPDDVAGRAAETARRLKDLSVRMGADHVVPLATSALRDSPDREALASLFEGAIGTEVRFIDGREEARLTFAGVTASVALGQGPTLLLDLGGGSLEVALAGPEMNARRCGPRSRRRWPRSCRMSPRPNRRAAWRAAGRPEPWRAFSPRADGGRRPPRSTSTRSRCPSSAT